MKNKTIYVFTQVFVGVISLTAFIAFTYPFLKNLGVTEITPIEDNSLKKKLTEQEASYKIIERETEKPALPRTSTYSARAKKENVNKRVTEPANLASTKESSTTGTFGSLKQGIEATPEVKLIPTSKITSVDTLDNIERAFKITSNIVGTICPIFGLVITVLLWKSQRKKIEDERCVLFKD